MLNLIYSKNRFLIEVDLHRKFSFLVQKLRLLKEILSKGLEEEEKI